MEPTTIKKGNIALIILALAILLAGYLLWKNSGGLGSLGVNGSDNSGNEVNDNKYADYPVSPSHSSILASEKVRYQDQDAIKYSFQGKITNVSQASGGTKITIENGSNLPDMIVTSSTSISSLTQVEGQPLSIKKLTSASLKEGVSVRATMYYKISDKTWTLEDIYIPN